MDERLLELYNLELRHLRETAAEFGRDFPKVAGRLALDLDAKEICPDPYVERLLEGFAFLAAFLCVRWLLRYVSHHDFVPFAWYRIVFGVIIVATSYAGLVDWS